MRTSREFLACGHGIVVVVVVVAVVVVAVVVNDAALSHVMANSVSQRPRGTSRQMDIVANETPDRFCVTTGV
jgi:hypothetical protein